MARAAALASMYVGDSSGARRRADSTRSLALLLSRVSIFDGSAFLPGEVAVIIHMTREIDNVWRGDDAHFGGVAKETRALLQ